MMERARIVLKSGKDQSVLRKHPWIFSGAIKKIYGEALEGDVVDVFDNKDKYLGRGHYQPGSIAVRLLTFEDQAINADFYSLRISEAYEYRKRAGILSLESTTAFRLIHAEGDNLPGLIVDVYGSVAVMQMHSIGMYYKRELIADILMSLPDQKIKAVFDKSESTLPYKAKAEAKNGFVRGSQEDNLVTEYGYRFHVDWLDGQKTGFFIDQRENRKLLKSFSENRRILNLFSYTGGFSVYGMSNARLVHTVDVSDRAVKMAENNVKLNFKDQDKHRGIVSDAFKFMDDASDDYDLIVLDPPAFAKHHNVLHNALQGYKKLNRKAIEIIEPGGIIFTFSCSQVVSRENFRKSVFTAAAGTGRKVRIIKQLSQPADHPVNIFHPESEYLKGLILYIE